MGLESIDISTHYKLQTSIPSHNYLFLIDYFQEKLSTRYSYNSLNKIYPLTPCNDKLLNVNAVKIKLYWIIYGKQTLQ